jgi:integrating conjugative element protein (TIGR03755 family)
MVHTSIFRVCSRIALLGSLLVGLSPSSGLAQYSPARDSDWYYRIGGAQAVSSAANPLVGSTSLNGNLDLSHIYSCGNFSPVAGLSNILNSAQNQVMAAYGNLVNAVTSAIGALPAFILQRAAPGLYDLYQNAVIRAEALLGSANTSCEAMEAEIRGGGNPYEDFIKRAKGFDWRVQMGKGPSGSSPTDVKTAKDWVESNNGKNGIPWLGGSYAGGVGQNAVLAVTDTVKAGYNIELGRGVMDTASSSGKKTRLSEIWASPTDAQNYALYVLGDVELTSNPNTPRKATPGHGILPKIETDKAPILRSLHTIVRGTDNPDPTALAKVSAPGIDLTREVIQAIRNLPTPQEKEAAIQKLADEAATAVNLEKALMLRRLLQSGRMEPNIYASGLGRDIDLAVGHISQAIENVLFETRIRREMFSQTATVLLGSSQNRAFGNAATSTHQPNDAKKIIDGEVLP